MDIILYYKQTSENSEAELDETFSEEIASFYDMQSNPFSVGDIFHPQVNELKMGVLETKYNSNIIESLKEKSIAKSEMFKHTSKISIGFVWKIVEKQIYVEVNPGLKDRIKIDFYCEPHKEWDSNAFV